MRRNLFVVCSAAVAIAVLFQSGFTADAARLLTGRDIRDGSITSADVRDGTLRAEDFRPGVLSQAGHTANRQVVTAWSGRVPASSEIASGMSSRTRIAPHTVLTPASLKASGDFSSCYAAAFTVSVNGALLAQYYRPKNGATSQSFTPVALGPVSGPLTVSAECTKSAGLEWLPVPAYSFEFVFEARTQSTTVTHRIS